MCGSWCLVVFVVVNSVVYVNLKSHFFFFLLTELIFHCEKVGWVGWELYFQVVPAKIPNTTEINDWFSCRRDVSPPNSKKKQNESLLKTHGKI